jgi:hypothetical protein
MWSAQPSLTPPRSQQVFIAAHLQCQKTNATSKHLIHHTYLLLKAVIVN